MVLSIDELSRLSAALGSEGREGLGRVSVKVWNANVFSRGVIPRGPTDGSSGVW
jgi:hypothetical protein